MKTTKYYKGDIVHRTTADEISYDKFWVMKILGVLEDTEDINSHVILWHRPFKNKIKHLFYIIKKFFTNKKHKNEK